MAKITFEAPIKMIFGKISKYSNRIFRRIPNNEMECSVYELHPYAGERSESQKANQELFGLAVKAEKNLTEIEKAAYEVAFKKQHKYTRLYNYRVAMERAKLELTNS
jgi:hypothetical protein